LIAALCVGVVQPARAAADDYPARPLRMLVPFPPGGSNDTIARLVGQNLSERLGKTVIIDNRAGAGGLVGIEIASKAPTDGYTALAISISYAFNSALRTKLSYDPVKAFVPVSKIATGPVVFVVSPSLAAKSIKELIAYARAKPGQLTFASSGIGGAQHLAFELFRSMTRIEYVHVPFKGGAPAALDLMAGNSHVGVASVISFIPHIRAGKLRALATGSLKRSAVLPEVPTVDESGVPGYEGANWWGVLLPAGVPASVVLRLDKELAGVLAIEDVRKRLSYDGAEPDYMSRGAFGKFIGEEMAKWTRVVKEAGITPQ
jgi:tripartite-type tricarboxylate transporter receptor subunit TctC